MPSLGRHDPLQAKPADKAAVDRARLEAESVVTVGQHTLQFDRSSRERMRLVIKGAEQGDQINWKMLDNSVVAFFKEDLESLYEAAEVAAGKKLLQVHAKAQEFKSKLDDGQLVTLRDIQLNNW